MDQDQAPEAAEAAEAGGQRVSNAEIARQAFVHSLASNLAMLALMVAVQVAIAKRDTIILTIRRAAGRGPHSRRQARINREVAEFRTDIDQITHAAGGLTFDEP